MSVDANVLIFERIREELLNNKSVGDIDQFIEKVRDLKAGSRITLRVRRGDAERQRQQLSAQAASGAGRASVSVRRCPLAALPAASSAGSASGIASGSPAVRGSGAR